MARHASPRTVQCYLCRHRFEVPGRAESTACPKCHKAIIVGDLNVKQLKGPLKEVRTCGHISVSKRGRIIAELIEAHRGIDCEGAIEAKRVVTGGAVSLGAKSQWRGKLSAPRLVVKKGARIAPSTFNVPDDPLGVADLV